MPVRCAWVGDDPLLVAYHDREWGVPVHDPRVSVPGGTAPGVSGPRGAAPLVADPRASAPLGVAPRVAAPRGSDLRGSSPRGSESGGSSPGGASPGRRRLSRVDRVLFEFLLLEGAQAGLSWLTILRKREHYRRAFAGFDPARVARFGAREVRRLLADPGIVRNRLKVRGAIQNARAFLAVQEEFGSFDRFQWQFVGGRPKQNAWAAVKEVPARTPESDAMSRALRERGFTFVGSTICYAHMQAVGMVNDHTVDCFRYPAVAKKGAWR